MPEDSPGVRIAKRRHVLGLNQTELAECIGVARDTVSMWERGKQKPHRHLGKLEHCLSVPGDPWVLVPEPVVDPAEAEVRATLERLRAAGHEELEGGGLERVMDAIRAERARHRNSAAKRAG